MMVLFHEYDKYPDSLSLPSKIKSSHLDNLVGPIIEAEGSGVFLICKIWSGIRANTQL
jgi:hypothetical protein